MVETSVVKSTAASREFAQTVSPKLPQRSLNYMPRTHHCAAFSRRSLARHAQVSLAVICGTRSVPPAIVTKMGNAPIRPLVRRTINVAESGCAMARRPRPLGFARPGAASLCAKEATHISKRSSVQVFAQRPSSVRTTAACRAMPSGRLARAKLPV